MAMVFTLASRAGEWLDETFVETVKKTEADDERIKREAEEVFLFVYYAIMTRNRNRILLCVFIK